MVWARRALVSLLSLLLLVCLVGTALSTSADSALGHPHKVETWLNQSNLYQKFLTNAVSQAITSAGSSQAQGSITLSDSAVQQAAQAAFTNTAFEKNLNNFLNSNYSWLEGKSVRPNFTIDLTIQKQAFASQIGQYVQDHIVNLPVCSAQQLAALGNVSSIDPLNATCRPSNLDAQAEADQVTQEVYNSGGFLSDPVITANNINPKGAAVEPYYQKYSKAPHLYQAAVKLPWLYGAVAGLCALGIVFLARRKRAGLRIVAGSLLISGLILLVIKLASDTIFKHLENHVFNQTSNGQLQQSLTQFFGKVESEMSKIELYFVIGYVVLAVIILAVLLARRNRKPRAAAPVNQPPIAPNGSQDSIASRLSNAPRKAPKTAPTALRPPKSTRPPKRPPLIQ